MLALRLQGQQADFDKFPLFPCLPSTHLAYEELTTCQEIKDTFQKSLF